MIFVWIALAVIVVATVVVIALVVPKRRGGDVDLPPVPTRPVATRPPSAPPEAETSTETPDVSVEDLTAPPALETPEPTAGRLQRLRARLARSQSTLGRGLLSVLSRDRLDDDAWDEVEEALLTADVGVGATTEIVERLRTRTRVEGTRSPDQLRALLTENS